MEIEYNDFFSEIGKKTEPSILRALYPVIAKASPGTISLCHGNPNPINFPFTKMSLSLRDGTTIELDEKELRAAQQYSPTEGMEKYRKIIDDLVYRLHEPPCWESTRANKTTVNPTAGATDAICQVCATILNPGDNVLIENVAFPGTVATLRRMNLKPIPLDLDGYGIIPDSLRKALSKWDPASKPGSTDKPKLLLTVPTGQNPSGSTLPLERKKEIYKLAQQYNFLIFEDDPYFMITFDERAASFLSIDTDGRVLRGDSFSKTFSPGLRAGYLSGPEAIITKIRYSLGITSQGTCAISQGIIKAYMDKFGIEGFLKSSTRIAKSYQTKRDIVVRLAEKWLHGLVEYSTPSSGMFLWMKIIGCDDTKELILVKGLQKKVLAVPGEFFASVEGQKSSYIRVSFSMEPEDTTEQALQRLAELIRENVASHTSK